MDHFWGSKKSRFLWGFRKKWYSKNIPSFAPKNYQKGVQNRVQKGGPITYQMTTMPILASTHAVHPIVHAAHGMCHSLGLLFRNRVFCVEFKRIEY